MFVRAPRESDTHAWAYRPRMPVAVVVPVYDRRSPVFSRVEQLRRMINVNGADVVGEVSLLGG